MARLYAIRQPDRAALRGCHDQERRRALYDRFEYSQRFSRIDPWAERVAGRHADEFNPLSLRMEYA